MKGVGLFIPLIILLVHFLLRFGGRSYSHSDTLQSVNILHNPALLDFNTGLTLIAIQAEMNNEDYSSAEAFYNKLNSYFQALKHEGIPLDSSLVLFPEHIGTWLVAAEEHRWITASDKISTAMALMAIAHPLQLIKNLLHAPKGLSDKIAYALFRTKSGVMSNSYFDTFTRLSTIHKCFIIAGSIVLPEVNPGDDPLTFDDGPLFNQSFLFHPNGQIDSTVVRKIYPIDSELGFLSGAKPPSTPVYTIGNHRVGVLICADSWSPGLYLNLKENRPDILAVPSFATGNQLMDKLWMGYNGQETPEDVKQEDINSITERAAWMKYGLCGRIHSSGAKMGMNVFLRGQLWDLGSDGQSSFISTGSQDSLLGSTGTSTILVSRMADN